MAGTIYYSQEDSRWKHVLYTIINDKTQTIGTSGCAPTCMAMVISTYTKKTYLPTEAAAHAIKYGFRTKNNGTAWGYFKHISESKNLKCVQTAYISEVKTALKNKNLVVASMGVGNFTSGGHYILLNSIENRKDGDWIEVYDPNHDNTKYGTTKLIEQGIKNDGIVLAHESIIKSQAKQYWIIENPNKEDSPMTDAEKKAFDELKNEVKNLKNLIEAQTKIIASLNESIKSIQNKQSMNKIPSFAQEAVDAAVSKNLVDTPYGGSYDFYRILTVLHRGNFI